MESLAPILSSSLSLPSPDLTDMKTWYDRTYGSAGSVDAWVWETVNGRDYSTRMPHFRAFVAVTERLDRFAAKIAALALREGKLVLGFNLDNRLLSVSSLLLREDEAGGWAVCGTPIGE